MKTGTASIDINEYDRLMKVERDLDLIINETKEVNKIFKERSAESEFISKSSVHEYIIKDKNGRKTNKYFYKEGLLNLPK